MKTRILCLVLSLVCNFTSAFEWPFVKKSAEQESWNGKWFPHSPDKAVDENPTVEYGNKNRHDLMDPKHGIKMGIPSPHCDDGKVNITLDWDNLPINHTCFEDRHEYLPDLNVHPIFHNDPIPSAYSAPHRCMDTPIFYDDIIPTFGTHRPLWPKYGEYMFVPRQRWLHSLEHGAIVMLYHPCANAEEVELLRSLVKGCLYRHIITPYNLLQPKRPLALVSWGNRLEMSKVVPKIAVDFIKSTALNGPEQKSENGQFEYGLLRNAVIVSDQEDSNLCPNLN